MTEKAKSWVRLNIMELIIAAMIGAFFASYQVDRAQQDRFQDEIKGKFDDHESRLVTIENIVILSNPDLDEWQKQALLEYARKRGGVSK